MAERLSREEFRRWAGTQKGRYERIEGVPVAMPPERAEHIWLKNRFWSALDKAVRDAALPCEALGDGITVEIDADTDYEPDALVNCGPALPGEAIAATNPVIVVEVTSPSAQSIDVAEKFADYFRLASIQHYLIVRGRRREVIHHSRVGTQIVTRIIDLGAISLDPPGITIDLAEIYPATA
jgi:Uma2 family endonuclease